MYFHGTEIVDVLAGALTSCKFREYANVNDVPRERRTLITSWVVRGISAKEVTQAPDGSGLTNELNSARVYGVAFVP